MLLYYGLSRHLSVDSKVFVYDTDDTVLEYATLGEIISSGIRVEGLVSSTDGYSAYNRYDELVPKLIVNDRGLLERLNGHSWRYVSVDNKQYMIVYKYSELIANGKRIGVSNYGGFIGNVLLASDGLYFIKGVNICGQEVVPVDLRFVYPKECSFASAKKRCMLS